MLERLNARLSREAVVCGVIEYPEPFSVDGGEPSCKGTLIVAKAVLTPKMPYELLTYALKEAAFPRQSTGDQFFDHEQFDVYRALGHFIGTAALDKVATAPTAAVRPAGVQWEAGGLGDRALLVHEPAPVQGEQHLDEAGDGPEQAAAQVGQVAEGDRHHPSRAPTRDATSRAGSAVTGGRPSGGRRRPG